MAGSKDPRVAALRNFAVSISAFTIVGYLFLGFEQAWLSPVVVVATGYTLELALETISARAEGRPRRFSGHGVKGLVEFLYPAHITALAVNLLLYVNDQLLVMMFAVAVAISGKWLLRVPAGGRLRHFMNPSNLGITVALLLFPWVSIAPPYHFTENVSGVADWAIPIGILVAGTLLNAMLTKRMWLIGAFLAAFALQAVLRSVFFGIAVTPALLMMTGAAFVLFVNYMVPDPGTTPWKPGSQVAFGTGVAAFYGLFTALHIAYGLFFSVSAVCLVRGLFLWSLYISNQARERASAAPAVAPAVRSAAGDGQPAKEGVLA